MGSTIKVKKFFCLICSGDTRIASWQKPWLVRHTCLGLSTDLNRLAYPDTAEGSSGSKQFILDLLTTTEVKPLYLAVNV